MLKNTHCFCLTLEHVLLLLVAFPRFIFGTLIHQKPANKTSSHESRHLNNHNLIELCAQLAKTHDLSQGSPGGKRSEVDGATNTVCCRVLMNLCISKCTCIYIIIYNYVYINLNIRISI